MQALQHSGAWGDNSTPFFLDNNEDYAFISIKWSFLNVLTPDIKSQKKVEKKHVSSIFKYNKNWGGISLYNSTINQLFQTLQYSFKSSVKAFKPYHGHNWS